MIHLKIISAHHLPSINSKSNHLYVKAYLVNYDITASKSIGVTKKVKKISDPSWHEVILIPFVAAQFVRLEICDETSHGNVQIIGSAKIQLTESNINGKEQKVEIELEPTEEPEKKHHEQPVLKYSIEPCTHFPFKIKYYKNPDAFYSYLSYDPPLKHNEKVELDFGSINNEGTAIQGIENYFVSCEREPTHFGPTGPTQAFYFSRLNFVDAQFFLYVKTHHYIVQLKVQLVIYLKNSSNQIKVQLLQLTKAILTIIQ